MTKSVYGDRETVGSLALKAQKSNENAEMGDLSRELTKSLADEINETIEANSHRTDPYYIVVHEKKDLMLKNALLRRIIIKEKRPYPEPATSVWKVDPKGGETFFCWMLPHWSNFPNILSNQDRYHEDLVNDIKAYKNYRLDRFGFKEVLGIVYADPSFSDRRLKK